MHEYSDFFIQNKILVVVWIGLAAAIIYMTFKSATAKFKTIMPSQLTHMTNHQDAIIVDVRPKDDFSKGHIAGSIHLLPSDIKAGHFEAIGNQMSKPIIVVCKMGQTAQTAAADLIEAGFENVNVLKNGLVSWDEANMPLVSNKSHKSKSAKSNKKKNTKNN